MPVCMRSIIKTYAGCRSVSASLQPGSQTSPRALPPDHFAPRRTLPPVCRRYLCNDEGLTKTEDACHLTAQSCRCSPWFGAGVGCHRRYMVSRPCDLAVRRFRAGSLTNGRRRDCTGFAPGCVCKSLSLPVIVQRAHLLLPHQSKMYSLAPVGAPGAGQSVQT